ncbi:SMP-30/gluconolactonase/LRE family protein [Patescibacteria group bacterium]|nr:SMP-30/gluconolactonase/LRE family protein [Patescibacteria group bacterium]
MSHFLIKTKVEPVLNKRVGLGEGAYWDFYKNLLYWIDIHEKKLFIFNPLKKQNKEIKFKEEIGAVVASKDGCVILATKNKFIKYNFLTGRSYLLAILNDDRKNIRFNDGKCDPMGRFWVGTMDETGKPNKGSLYFLGRDYSIEKRINKVTISNGITWSLNRKTLYYIDSPTYSVVSYEFDEKNGGIKNKRIAIEINSDLGMPDGMTIDNEGMLWIALYGGGKIARYNPQNGRLMAILEIPGAKLVTSCSFGGNDLSDLYITTSSYGLNNVEKKQQHNAGRLLKAKVGEQGVPLWRFL